MSDSVGFYRSSFSSDPTVRAVAPGRIEFIGNHTDYNGGLVLGLAVDRVIEVSAAPRDDNLMIFRSEGREAVLSCDIRSIIPQRNSLAWANYPLGVFLELRAAGMGVFHGCQLAITSTVPDGAGMSSSAALEVGSAMAFCRLYRFQLNKGDLVRLCSRADNQFSGIPTGILDQGVSTYGKRQNLVYINCGKGAFDRIPLPDEIRFWVFDTGKKHVLAVSPYHTRHSECMEALHLLRENLPQAEDLSDFSPEQIRLSETYLASHLFARALHVAEENERVRQVIGALKRGDLEVVGRCLFASHESSRTLFENSCEELDTLVSLLRDCPRVIGARLTGGGFGGAVMALTRSEFSRTDADVLAERYAERYGHRPEIFQTEAAGGAHVESLS